MRCLGRDQRAGKLAFREHRFGRDQDQHLVEVGGERLGADLVLAIEQVAPLLHLLDRPLVALARWGGLPQHAVAHHGLALLAAWVANAALAVG